MSSQKVLPQATESQSHHTNGDRSSWQVTPLPSEEYRSPRLNAKCD
ncbi:hypothetical protein [Scytonema sp. NUACC21]